MKPLLLIILLNLLPASSPILLLDFEKADWKEGLTFVQNKGWGDQSFSVVYDKKRKSKVLKVSYPKGSVSPNATRFYGAPVGGGQFLIDACNRDSASFYFDVKFERGFDFVKGGKLPGLYGGAANSGGHIPDGYDGFSTRMMWRKNGEAEIYAYTPKSEQWGTSFKDQIFNFQPGKWHHIKQKLVLNDEKAEDGKLCLWIDDSLIVDQKNILFRKTKDLKINGIFFSTFFGGQDSTWASQQDNYIYFDNFRLED